MPGFFEHKKSLTGGAAVLILGLAWHQCFGAPDIESILIFLGMFVTIGAMLTDFPEPGQPFPKP